MPRNIYSLSNSAFSTPDGFYHPGTVLIGDSGVVYRARAIYDGQQHFSTIVNDGLHNIIRELPLEDNPQVVWFPEEAI